MTVRTVPVSDPDNAPVAINPFRPGIYRDCASAPQDQKECLMVGAVDHEYGIGELEITVDQYVTFLNVVDPDGTNALGLYVDSMSPSAWPKYGPISLVADASRGAHYQVGYPQWASKPIGFIDFFGAARFANALTNGAVLSADPGAVDGVQGTTYRVRLSPETDNGMYDLGANGEARVREQSTGFVIPSQGEWIKAAYYDPSGGGTFSYWEFPTGPTDAPNVAMLDPDTGAVVNASSQPLSSYNPAGRDAQPGTYPVWCPPDAGQTACDTVNPLGLSESAYQGDYHASLGNVGETLTRSPWGTRDQGGNVVEWTDTVAPNPSGTDDAITWRYLHGGVSNAPAYQLWISAVGHAPESDPLFAYSYPWQGFRIGVIGEPGGG